MVESLMFQSASPIIFPSGIEIWKNNQNLYVSDSKANQIFVLSRSFSQTTATAPVEDSSDYISYDIRDTSLSGIDPTQNYDASDLASYNYFTVAKSEVSLTSAATKTQTPEIKTLSKSSKTSIYATPSSGSWRWNLVTSPLTLQSDIELGVETLFEPYEISFDIVISDKKNVKSYIFVMVIPTAN